MAVELLSEQTTVEPAVQVASADQVDVLLDELIVGRTLEFPMYNDLGVLLLAAGSTISTEGRRMLQQHGVSMVRVHSRDAARLRLHADDAEFDDAPTVDLQAAEKLDRMIDTGLLSITNSGPAVKVRLVPHGRKSYEPGRRESLYEQKHAVLESIEDMVKMAVHGQPVSSTKVTQFAAQYLSRLVADSDCSLSVMMEAARDKVLADHCLKMATLGMAIGIEMGLDEDNCKRIYIAGLVHDWGMAKVPAEIRNAPRLLSEHELHQIRKHPIYTLEIIERLPRIPPLVPLIVYQVHERPNGTGYPRGRSGDQIHLFARILAVADTYAALTEERHHRLPLAPYAAMECLIRMAKHRDLDNEAVRALLKVVALFPIGSFVTLDDGSVARVLRRSGDRYTTPVVQIVQDASGNAAAGDRSDVVLDLADSPRSIVQALPTPGRSEAPLSKEILFPVRPRI
jgi:HD-GYP domain-containing protein (c-di-GMP phosphodiesterase class II)